MTSTADEVARWAAIAAEARTMRDDAIRRMHAEGHNLRAIADAAGLTRMGVHNIINRK